MQNFYLDGDISYSLEEVATFSRDKGGMLVGLEEFLHQRMMGEEADLNEVISIGMALGEEVPYSHAVTILANEKDSNLLFSDSHAALGSYWPSKPAGQRDKPFFKLNDLTD